MFKFLVQTAALLNFALLAVNYRKIERIHTVTFIVVYSPISVFYTSQFVPQIFLHKFFCFVYCCFCYAIQSYLERFIVQANLQQQCFKCKPVALRKSFLEHAFRPVNYTFNYSLFVRLEKIRTFKTFKII